MSLLELLQTVTKAVFICSLFSFVGGLELPQLGDPDNKAASNADYHLSNLLSDHPNMKVWIFISLCCFNLFNLALEVLIIFCFSQFWSLSANFACLIWFLSFLFSFSFRRY